MCGLLVSKVPHLSGWYISVIFPLCWSFPLKYVSVIWPRVACFPMRTLSIWSIVSSLSEVRFSRPPSREVTQWTCINPNVHLWCINSQARWCWCINSGGRQGLSSEQRWSKHQFLGKARTLLEIEMMKGTKLLSIMTFYNRLQIVDQNKEHCKPSAICYNVF